MMPDKKLIAKLAEYIENDEYGEYLERLINLYNVVRYSGDDEFTQLIDLRVKNELEYCENNFEIIYTEYTETIRCKEIIEK